MRKKSTDWGANWALNFRCWLERDGRAVLGKGRAELLSAIDKSHSISAAAREVGMSYRHAWVLVQQINEAAGLPLVESSVGGKRGGGARLTDMGKQAIEIFENLRNDLAPVVSGAFKRGLSLQSTVSCLHLVAATSLQEAVGQILTEFALREPSTHVRAVFGASNELASHLLRGMSADVFISADRVQLDRLGDAGLAASDSIVPIAKNGLAAIAAADSKLQVKKAVDLLDAKVGRIVLAEPDCPLGKSSRQYLERLGIYESLLPKVLYVDNARAVLAVLHSGRADVGLAFANETIHQDSCRTLFRTPISQASTEYVGAVLQTSVQPDAASRVLQFFRGESAVKCFRRCGFHVPSTARAS